MAVDYLPIQGSSVPCERVFSSSAETVTKRRNKISPELMEELQMLKYSLKKGRPISFTQGTSKEEETKYLEELFAENSRVPEDPTGFDNFIRSLLEVESDTE